jgi:hypothetical protein
MLMTESAPPLRPRARSGIARFSAVELLIAIVVLFVGAPFLQELPYGAGIEAGLMSLVLITAVAAIGGQRRMLFIAALLGIPAFAGRWLHHFRPDLWPLPLYLLAAMSFIGFVVVHLLRFVLQANRVNTEVLCASIAAYLLIGLVWAHAYMLVGRLHPEAFAFNTPGAPAEMDGFSGFYFSFLTLTTVGYGDITPVSPVARMLAVMESMTGMLYVAVLIARLVAMYSTPSSSDRSNPSN